MKFIVPVAFFNKVSDSTKIHVSILANHSIFSISYVKHISLQNVHKSVRHRTLCESAQSKAALRKNISKDITPSPTVRTLIIRACDLHTEVPQGRS